MSDGKKLEVGLKHVAKVKERGHDGGFGHLAVPRVHNRTVVGGLGDAVRAVAAQREKVDRVKADAIMRR